MINHIQNICKEYMNAIKKHPFFAKTISSSSLEAWELTENRFKKINDKKENAGSEDWAAEEILCEEVAEAMHAAAAGETAHAIQEFYQVAAVCLRCIDLLENKKNARSK